MNKNAETLCEVFGVSIERSTELQEKYLSKDAVVAETVTTIAESLLSQEEKYALMFMGGMYLMENIISNEN
jgi:hypothetical protein